MPKTKELLSFQYDNFKIEIPVVTLRGEGGDGPTAAITAGIHGCEYTGIFSLLKLASELDLKKLKGTLKLITIASLDAFEKRNMFVSPLDGKNPNRYFPGAQDGTFTNELNFRLMQAIQGADYYLDLHAGDLVEALVPFTLFHKSGDNEMDGKALAIAKHYNLPNICSSTTGGKWADDGTTYANVAKAFNIPAVIAEVGGFGQLDAKAVEIHTEGLFNVFKHMGNIEGTPQPFIEQTRFNDMVWLYTKNKGFYYNEITIGDEVKQGDHMGTLFNYFGDVVETLTAPADGRVLFRTTSPAMTEKGLIAGIGIRGE